MPEQYFDIAVINQSTDLEEYILHGRFMSGNVRDKYGITTKTDVFVRQKLTKDQVSKYEAMIDRQHNETQKLLASFVDSSAAALVVTNVV